MTPDDVRAAVEQLVQFHERFAALFGKEQAHVYAYDYLKGVRPRNDVVFTGPFAGLSGVRQSLDQKVGLSF
jgi:hypothetical protein